jgi:hypothetical protein
VEISLVFRAHPSEDLLEEYAFGRLNELQAAPLEEHLLLCTSCQEVLAGVDQYIHFMKVAAQSEAAQSKDVSRIPAGRGSWSDWLRELAGRLQGRPGRAVWATALGLAMGSAAAVVWQRSPASMPDPVVVALASYRGGGNTASAVASAGRPLDLAVDLPDLPPAAAYRLEVVTSRGSRAWEGTPQPAGGKLSAHLAQGLRPGMYWVRLYAAPSDLLSEYGLRIK